MRGAPRDADQQNRRQTQSSLNGRLETFSPFTLFLLSTRLRTHSRCKSFRWLHDFIRRVSEDWNSIWLINPASLSMVLESQCKACLKYSKRNPTTARAIL